ncbi:MAG: ubiquinone/menaquinone biosynthesis methyltransferase [Candidatus Brocadiia bacterium]
MTDRVSDSRVSCSPEEATRLSGNVRREYVKNLFDNLSGKYDFMNNIVSLWGTSRWRAKALKQFMIANGDRLLDVGTGTGLLPCYLAKQRPDLDVTGVDISKGMLSVASKRCPNAVFMVADATALPFENGSFGSVCSAFVIRNLQDRTTALSEMARVLKPNGRMMILDSFAPLGWRSPMMRFWLRSIMPVVASVFTDNRPYKYLAASICGPDLRPELTRTLVDLGLEIEYDGDIELGTIHLLVARKPASSTC